MTGADTWTEMFDAHWAQANRLRGAQPLKLSIEGDFHQALSLGPWAPDFDLYAQSVSQRYGIPGLDAPVAVLFRYDAERPMDGDLQFISSLVRAEDQLVDVGGGAGRLSFPLGKMCGRVVNLERSGAMAAAFAMQLEDLELENVTLHKCDWRTCEHLDGDVAIAIGVIDSVRDIGAFVRFLDSVASRCAIVSCASGSFGRIRPDLFQQLYAERLAPLPALPELMAVLADVGISAATHVNTNNEGARREGGLAQTHDEAIELLVHYWNVPEKLQERARNIIAINIEQLVIQTPRGLVLQSRDTPAQTLVYWISGRARSAVVSSREVLRA